MAKSCNLISILADALVVVVDACNHMDVVGRWKNQYCWKLSCQNLKHHNQIQSPDLAQCFYSNKTVSMCWVVNHFVPCHVRLEKNPLWYLKSNSKLDGNSWIEFDCLIPQHVLLARWYGKHVTTCNSNKSVWTFASFVVPSEWNWCGTFDIFVFLHNLEFCFQILKPDNLHYRKRHLVSATSRGPQGTNHVNDLKSMLDLAMECSGTMVFSLPVAWLDTKQMVQISEIVTK